MNIHGEISTLKGVGPKTAQLFNKCGIFTIMDLLLYFPRGYESVSFVRLEDIPPEGEKVVLQCTVIEVKRDIRTRNGKMVTTILFRHGNRQILGKWFNQTYVKNNFRNGQSCLLMGKVQENKGEIVMMHPALLKEENTAVNTVQPVYPLKGDLTQNLLSKLISQVLAKVEIQDNLPEAMLQQYSLCSLDTAVRNIHAPKDMEVLKKSQNRLKFQELFAYSLKILMIKEFNRKAQQGIAFKMSEELKTLKDKLPFQLTNAQSKVIREVLLDQKNPRPMNRLVQGDVGSGKTIIAFVALFNVIRNGYQAAMMAPTEILAQQHFEEAKKLFSEFNLSMELLTGSVTAKNKERIKTDLRDGKIQLIFGTHALLEDDVEFRNLGMVITDEQHRFGVMQRSKLFNKAKNVDILVMTATPIPRTLTLYLYGDLDVSIVDELPPGRQKIETYYLNENAKNKAYTFAVNEIASGRQVYIVCPLVEENEELDLHSVEELFHELKAKYFSKNEIQILHGKMSPKIKNEIMQEFKKGKTQVLLSTTVIEVGVNVPNASIMIIENAERFGLSQLHQLRGRVGRGQYQSYCILIANMKSDATKKRMEIMKNSSDGFYIAEQDLKIRGGGEILGFRQHGENGLVLSDPVEDMELLKQANQEARRILQSTAAQDEKIREEILRSLENSARFICFN